MNTLKMKPLRKALAVSVVGGLVMQLSACGTILYPERKGQASGALDAGVVALDAVGLLFFLIPGVIAFAVDFSNGTIYLPGGDGLIDTTGVGEVKTEGELTDAKIEQVILERTGRQVNLSDESVQRTRPLETSSIYQQVRYL